MSHPLPPKPALPLSPAPELLTEGKPSPHNASPHPSGEGARNTLTLWQANYALGVFLLAYMLSFMDRQILSLMVDPIRGDLHLSDIQMGLLQGAAFALLYMIMGIPFGLMADRFSRRKIIAGGILFWGLSTALSGLARSFSHIFVARIGVGVGEAALSPSVHSFLSNAFPRHRLARAMAVYNLGITVGGGLALVIGGSVVHLVSLLGDVRLPLFGVLHGWQAVFLLVSVPSLPVAILVLATKEPKRSTGTGPNRNAASLGTVLRYLWQHRRAFASIHFSSAILGIYGYSLLGWYPTLLIRNYGMSAGEAGIILGLGFLVLGSLGVIGAGLVADHWTKKGLEDANMRVVLVIGLLVTIPAGVAPLMPTVPLLLAVLAPALFLFNGYFSCAVAAIQIASPPSMRGSNSAVFLLTNSLVALAIGMLAVPVADKYIFGGTGNFGPALSLVGATAALGGSLIAFLGIGAYRKLVKNLIVST